LSGSKPRHAEREEEDQHPQPHNRQPVHRSAPTRIKAPLES
jgi:hypothetical protein